MGGSRCSRVAVAVWLVALCTGLQAKPVLTVWQELKAPRFVVVSPQTATAVGWAATMVKGVTVRPVSPEDYAKAPRPAKGEHGVVFLYNREDAAQWPEAVLKLFPRHPSTVGQGEVVAAYAASGCFTFCVVAPNALLLEAGFAELLKTDAGRCISQPLAMVSYKLQRALAIGRATARLGAWLDAQGSENLRYERTTVSPSDLKAEQLAGNSLVVVALTFEDWRKAVPAEVKEKLAAMLPADVNNALTGQEDSRVVAATAVVGDTRVAAAVAPLDRFLHQVVVGPLRGATPDGNLARIALATPTATGGAVRLADLRSSRRAALAYVDAEGQNQAVARGLSSKLRELLSANCGIGFTDDRILEASLQRAALEGALGSARQTAFDQAADLLMVLRLNSVRRETTFAETAPQCMEADPGEFDEYEPDEPGPNDRKWPFGPHKYPGRENDPQYLKDHAKWEKDQRAWQDRKTAYDYKRDHQTVPWERYLVATQMATVEALLELYSRDAALLCVVPLNGSEKQSETQTSRCNIQGFKARPPSLNLPPSRPSASDQLVADAVEQAVYLAAGIFLMRTLTPKDVGFVPPPSAPATRPEPTGEIVRVTGVGKLGADRAAARDNARQDAMRLAVEKVMGVYLDAETLVEKYQLVKDEIHTRTSGFAAVVKEVEEQEVDGAIQLTCDVEVQHRPLRDQLVKSGLARQWRVMVVLGGTQGKFTKGTAEAAETALQNRVIEASLPVVDRAQSLDLRDKRATLLELVGHPEAARALAQQYQAEVLLTGVAVADDTAARSGQPTCRASLTIKAIDLNTAEILASEEQTADAFSQSLDLAAVAACQKAAEQVSDKLIDRIFRRIGPLTERITLTVAGFTTGITLYTRFLDALKGHPAVTAVNREHLNQGLAEVELELKRGRKREFAVWLESAAVDPEFCCQVTADPGATILAKVRWNIDQERLQQAADRLARTVAVANAARERAATAKDNACRTADASKAEAPVQAQESVKSCRDLAQQAGQAADEARQAAERAKEAGEAAVAAARGNRQHAQVAPLLTQAQQSGEAAEQARQAATDADAAAGKAEAELLRRPVDIATPVPPFVAAGALMVPIKPLLDWLGAKTEWHAASRTLVVTMDRAGAPLTVTLVLDSVNAFVNGVPQRLPVAPQSQKGTTFVPLRFVAEAFGVKIEQDKVARCFRLLDGERTGLLPMPPPATPAGAP